MHTIDYIEYWTKMAEMKTNESVSDADVQRNLVMWYLDLACAQADSNCLDAALCSALEALKHIRLSFVASQKSGNTNHELIEGTEICEMWGENPGFPYMLEADCFFRIGHLLFLEKDLCNAYLCLLHAKRLCEVIKHEDYYIKEIYGEDGITDFAELTVVEVDCPEEIIYQDITMFIEELEKNIDTTKLRPMAELLKWAEGFEVNYWEKYSEILEANGESEKAENAKKHAEFLKKILFLENLK